MYDSFGLLNVGQELPSAPMIASGSSRRHHLQLKAIRGLKAIWIEADQTFPPPYRNPADLLLHGFRHLVAAGFPLHRIALALVPIETGQGGIQYWWDVENPEEVHSFFLGSEFFAGMDHRTSILHAVCEGKVPKRLRLEHLKSENIPYVLARDMCRERYADYLAVPLGSDGNHELILELAMQRPGGFLLWELAALNRLVVAMVPTIMACVGHEGRQWGWRDPLTALSNRGSFEQQLNEQIALSRVTGDPFSLVVLDLDDFGAYNDTFGHFCADDCLQAIARLLTRRLGADNPLVARVGADAFAMLLPSVTGGETDRLAAELVAEIQGLRIAHPAAADPFMSASVGIETHWPLLERADAQATEVLARAENALNRARQAKRSCQLVLH